MIKRTGIILATGLVAVQATLVYYMHDITKMNLEIARNELRAYELKKAVYDVQHTQIIERVKKLENEVKQKDYVLEYIKAALNLEKYDFLFDGSQTSENEVDLVVEAAIKRAKKKLQEIESR